MRSLRLLIQEQSRMALALLALVLLVRAAIPAGFMLTPVPGGFLTITLCPSTAPAAMVQSLDHAAMGHHAMIGMDHGADDTAPAEHGSKPIHCAFSGLGHVAIGGADIDLLAAMLAFVLLLAMRPVRRLQLARPSFLTPPLRAPPSFA